MPIISLLASVVGGSAVLVASARWMAGKLIENGLNKSIEAYKSSLRSESDAEIERLKSSLQMSVKEQEIEASWLHQKRAAAIEGLHSALVDLQKSVRIVLDMFSPRDPGDIRIYSADAVKKVRETYDVYLKAKIFMSPATCEKIERVLRGIEEPVVLYECYLSNYDDHELHTLSDVKDRAWEDI